ncbi:hypothetical protein VPH35_086819 [Triticum aestivum]
MLRAGGGVTTTTYQTRRGAVNENVGLEIQNIQEVVGGLVLVSEHGTKLVRFMIWTWFNVMNHLFCFCNIFFSYLTRGCYCSLPCIGWLCSKPVRCFCEQANIDV